MNTTTSQQKAKTMTSVTPTHTVYDDFSGPQIDPARWLHLERPLPDGTLHRAEEPGARVDISEGRLSIAVDRFQTSHDSLQSFDNTKHVIVSTGEFVVPKQGTASFEIQQTATLVGARDLDHTLGGAIFNLLDLQTGLVFDLAVSDRHVFAIHERFNSDPYSPTLFTHVVENPFAVTTQPGQPHQLKITFDSTNRVIRWLVDNVVIYHVDDAEIPAALHIAFGLFTSVKLTEQGSGSLQGQGLHASWSAPAITITEP